VPRKFFHFTHHPVNAFQVTSEAGHRHLRRWEIRQAACIAPSNACRFQHQKAVQPVSPALPFALDALALAKVRAEISVIVQRDGRQKLHHSHSVAGAP
jgi:hypothetical protein